jgi:hypothetical protein
MTDIVMADSFTNFGVHKVSPFRFRNDPAGAHGPEPVGAWSGHYGLGLVLVARERRPPNVELSGAVNQEHDIG